MTLFEKANITKDELIDMLKGVINNNNMSTDEKLFYMDYITVSYDGRNFNENE